MAERAADFSKAFPNKKISSETLRRIYIKNQVRKKKVKVTKIPNKKETKRIRKSIKEAKRELEHYRTRAAAKKIAHRRTNHATAPWHALSSFGHSSSLGSPCS